MRKILPIFSYLFHPIFIPILGAVSYMMLDSYYFSIAQYTIIFLQITIVTFLLPITFFYLLRAFGKVDNMMLSDISQRKIPLLLQIVMFYILIKKSITADIIPELYYFFLGGLSSMVLAFLLLFREIKASMHMIGISALTVFIIGLSIKNQINAVPLVAFLMILNGFVASSRLVMNAHTNRELLLGFLCGIIPQLGLLYIWL